MKLTFEQLEEMYESGQLDDLTVSKKGKDSFEIVEIFEKIGEKKNIVFAYVDWFGKKCYDLRTWNKDMSKPYKGIVFSSEEIEKISLLSFPGINEESDYRHLYEWGDMSAKIFENLMLLSESGEGDNVWNKEINIVDWGYGKKIDLRRWKKDYSKCSKGICLTENEFNKFLTCACNIKK